MSVKNRIVTRIVQENASGRYLNLPDEMMDELKMARGSTVVLQFSDNKIEMFPSEGVKIVTKEQPGGVADGIIGLDKDNTEQRTGEISKE